MQSFTALCGGEAALPTQPNPISLHLKRQSRIYFRQSVLFFDVSAESAKAADASDGGLPAMELKLKAGQFYGTTAQALSANGFRFTEKAYSSRARLPTHAHELSHFCFVLAGNYNESIAGKLFARGPATLVYYPPDVSHGEEHFTRGRHFLVEIDFKGLEKVKDYIPVCLVGSR